jgi:hypothetical protein
MGMTMCIVVLLCFMLTSTCIPREKDGTMEGRLPLTKTNTLNYLTLFCSSLNYRFLEKFSGQDTVRLICLYLELKILVI